MPDAQSRHQQSRVVAGRVRVEGLLQAGHRGGGVLPRAGGGLLEDGLGAGGDRGELGRDRATQGVDGHGEGQGVELVVRGHMRQELAVAGGEDLSSRVPSMSCSCTSRAPLIGPRGPSTCSPNYHTEPSSAWAK